MKALVLKDEQIVSDVKGKPAGVLLSLKTYERSRQAEEDLADIRAYDATRPKVAAELLAGRYATLACQVPGRRHRPAIAATPGR